MATDNLEDDRRSLAGRWEKSVQALQHVNQELEARVQERTSLYELANAALHESEERLRTVIGGAPIVLFALDRDGVFTLAEGRGLADIGLGPDDLVGRSSFEKFANQPDVLDSVRRALAGEPTTTFVGNNVTLEAQLSPVRDDEGSVTGVIGVATDITERRRAESLLAGQRKVLELIATGMPLNEILDDLVFLLEDQISGMIGSICLVSPDGTTLHPAAIGSLPADYVEAIADGVPIAEGAGSCGTSAHRRQSVIVSDISSDPLWNDYRELALSHDLRACWSAPIFSTTGAVLGTFAAYYREERTPDEETSRLVKIATHIAEIAIERCQAEEALRESESKFRGMTETVAASVLILQDERIKYANPMAKAMTGYSEDEFSSITLWDLVHPDFHEFVQSRRAIRQAGGEAPPNFELKIVTKNGSELWVDYSASVIEYDGKPAVLGTAFDITERKRVEEALREAANHDPLTGLLNRRAGTAAIGERLSVAKENGDAFAVMVLDLDRFKKINDSFGHETGDAALIQFSEVMSKLVGDAGVICRIGGDEFGIGIEKMDMEAALAFGRRFHSTLRYALARSDSDLRPQFTVSIGVACYPEDGADANVLGRRADRAMYEAKVSGCDTTRAWRQTDSDQAA